MENVASLAVLLAFCAAIYALVASMVGRVKRKPFLIVSGERAVYSVWALISIGSSILVYGLITGDFRFAYVAQHSNRAMPLLYKFAAWWGGQEGSLLFWSCWRLLGLAWAGNDKDATQKASRELLAAQRADGGWSDIGPMESTAYATGRALVALPTAGLSVSDAAYQRGVRYLLDTQLEDGSWYVRTRAMAFQPYFDAGFPHGFDQWISAAGTNWATMALSLVSPPSAVPPTALASRQ